MRELADDLVQVVVDSDGDEVAELVACDIEHAEGAVLRTRQVGRGLGDAAQHLGQVQVRADRHDRLEEGLDAVAELSDPFDSLDDLLEEGTQAERIGCRRRIGPIRGQTHGLRLRRPVTTA